MWYLNLALIALLNGVFAFMTYSDALLKKSILKTIAQILFWGIILTSSIAVVYQRYIDYKSETGFSLGVVVSAALVIFIAVFAAKRPQNI